MNKFDKFTTGLITVVSIFALTLSGCGGGTSSTPSTTDTTTTGSPITTTTGASDSAGAHFTVDKSLGQAGSNAGVGDVALTKGLYDKYGKPAPRGISGSFSKIDGFTYHPDGSWTGTGANGESITLYFYRASDTSTPITQDITEADSYGSGATAGPLYDLLDSSLTTLDESKVRMKIDITTTRSFSTGSCQTVNATLTTGIIAFSTGTGATYTMTGSGSGTLSNGQTISLDSMTVTVSNMGASISGSSITNIPMDDATYQVVCDFNQSGCVSNTVTKDGATVGTTSVVGSNVVFTDSATGEQTTISW